MATNNNKIYDVLLNNTQKDAKNTDTISFVKWLKEVRHQEYNNSTFGFLVSVVDTTKLFI